MARLRVLYLTNVPSPYRVDFFNELGRACDLTVLFEATLSGERHHRWHKYEFTNFEAVFLKGIKIRQDDALSMEVMRFLTRESFDVIVVGGYSTPTGMLAILWLKMRNIPFVLNVDGGFVPSRENGIKKHIKSYFIKSASAWLSTGQKTNEYLFHYGAKEDQTYVYPFTTMYESEILLSQPSLHDKVAIRRKLEIIESKMILTVGRFVYEKGFDILIRACDGLPKDWGIYFVGGEPTEEYQELKEQYCLTNVHFAGFKSKEQLAEYYMAADLFVLPTRGDVWGLVVNEAMSFGLPVITTDKCVAGLELITDNANGFIVPVNDIEILRYRIMQVLSNDNLAKKMGEESLDVVSKYTIEKMAEEHVRVFETIRFNDGL